MTDSNMELRLADNSAIVSEIAEKTIVFIEIWRGII